MFNTHRGAIKRIKFAPGKGNMKVVVMFNDGIEVWDPVEVSACLFFFVVVFLSNINCIYNLMYNHYDSQNCGSLKSTT